MNVQTPTTAAEADRALYHSAPKLGQAEAMAFAARRSGKSVLTIGRDFARHQASGRGIEWADYLRYRLWDDAAHPGGTADRFIGANTVWPAAHAVNPRSWWAAAEDKRVMEAMLATDGLPLPRSVAVIDPSPRAHPGLARIEGPEALRELVLGYPQGALFLKQLDGMVGQGAMAIVAADEETIAWNGGAPQGYATFLTETLGEGAFLIQERLETHPALAPFCTGVSTIRLPNLVSSEGVRSPVATMKLTTGGNVACAFWRPGNLACGLDVETGEVIRVARREGPEVVALPDHPEVPGLIGLVLPFWKEIREINERAALLYSALPYQSTDIALTPDGPVLIELNYGGSFDILQNGTGKGFFTPEVRAFFEARGWPAPRADAAPKKRKRFGLI